MKGEPHLAAGRLTLVYSQMLCVVSTFLAAITEMGRSMGRRTFRRRGTTQQNMQGDAYVCVSSEDNLHAISLLNIWRQSSLPIDNIRNSTTVPYEVENPWMHPSCQG